MNFCHTNSIYGPTCLECSVQSQAVTCSWREIVLCSKRWHALTKSSFLCWCYILVFAPQCSYLRGFADLIFSDDSQAGILVPSVLPALSTVILLQQFVSLVPFPSYFAPLYSLLSELENDAQKVGLATPSLRQRSLDNAETNDNVGESISPSTIVTVLAEKVASVYPLLDRDGLNLLLLYIFPLFDHPSTCFDAAFNLFDTLSEYLTQRHLQKILVPSFLFMYDTFDKPSHRCQILGRLMADKLMKKFGLFVFLTRFLPCIIEAVIEPMANTFAGKKSTPTTVERQGSSDSPDAKELKTPALNHNPTLSRVASSSLTLNFTWDSHVYEFDKEDDDSGSETELSFPEASLLVGMNTTVFDLVPNGEQNGSLPTKQEACLSPLLEEEMQTEIPIDRHSLPEQQDPKPPVTSPFHSPRKPHLAAGTVNPHLLPVLQSPKSKDDSPDLLDSPGPDTIIKSSHSCFPSVSVLPPKSDGSHMVVPEEKAAEEGDSLSRSGSDVPTDPKTKAISSEISEVASDCVTWLIWRLGPLIATRHIAHQLLDNMHRCFTNVVHIQERQSAKDVLCCLASLVDYYGQGVVLQLYLPYIKAQVQLKD